MTKFVGVKVSNQMSTGLVVDHKLVGELHRFPEHEDDSYALVEMPTEGLVKTICEQVVLAVNGTKGVTAVGVALPGLIKNGVVEESPNLPQLKGARIEELLRTQLRNHDLDVSVTAVNDADAMAAGLASAHGKLDSTIRVWSLGVGIGYGRYPFLPGVWEGGHTVVTLDEKEHFCGCGGRGHLEGIMGHRAMRLRFLDMEPEEVFEAAKNGDPRCLEFKRMWHKALAAATATSIHMSGPGRVFLTGFNVRFLDLAMLRDYMQQMVKMSPLQSYSFEIVEDKPVTRVIGAAISAEQALER
ncbi:ROK family protein [Edaphobacter dinghuensis]|uniref:Glucokinase n=1 Tax=Edaphobacter dinghuensis TaxID=1560005 RepID=A0A917M1H8_9BACT|nr:ROK family protein [Edaphobacter dinghuensis]GGG69166.1 glucokinase [Edaphobacter dinghuensis]